jgi:hypothetical protein
MPKEGENPELCTLFFHCSRLMSMPLVPLFVSDGPKWPLVKHVEEMSGKYNQTEFGKKKINLTPSATLSGSLVSMSIVWLSIRMSPDLTKTLNQTNATEHHVWPSVMIGWWRAGILWPAPAIKAFFGCNVGLSWKQWMILRCLLDHCPYRHQHR